MRKYITLEEPKRKVPLNNEKGSKPYAIWVSFLKATCKITVKTGMG